jgi:membrane-associated phospholipid phosphatase
MHYIDVFVQQYFFLHQSLFLTQFFYLLTTLFDFSVTFVLVVLAIAGLIYLVRNIQYSALFLFVVFGGSAVVYSLKYLFHIARPVGGVLIMSDPSFPSWHSAISAIMFSMLMYVFDDYLSGWWRKIFNFACILMILLVSFSRIYLGVHWLSDVVGGVLVGFMFYLLTSSLFNKYVLPLRHNH